MIDLKKCKFVVFLSLSVVGLFAQDSVALQEKSAKLSEILASTSTDKNSAPASRTYASLIAKSPFKSIVSAPVIGRSRNDPRAVQFLGLTKIDGVLEFSIYDPASQRGYWLSLNKRSDNGVYVENYSESNSTITVYLPASGRQTLKMSIPEEAPKGIDAKSKYNYVGGTQNAGMQVINNNSGQKVDSNTNNNNNMRRARRTR